MSDNNQKFDNLILPMSKDLYTFYLIEMARRLPQEEFTDTAPLLNVTMSIFVSTLINVLDFIKSTTIGEVKLIDNIELAKSTLINAIKSMPFIKEMELHEE